MMWRNRRIGFHVYAAALLIMGVVLAVLVVERRVLPDALQWLRLHRPLWGIVAAFLSAVVVAQRRSLKRAQFARSWLAAAPVKRWTARWEALLIETWPASAAMGVLLVIALFASIVLAFGRSDAIRTIFGLWAYICCGIAIGVGMSFLIPKTKPVDLPPGSRYVPKPKKNRAAAIRPSFSALGLWPIRQMFAWAQPKLVARALIPILLMMPLGTTADVAMTAIAMFGVFFALSLLWSAAISVSRAARQWLAPLPQREAAIMRAFLFPACGVVAGAALLGSLLLLLFNASYAVSAEVGAIIAILGWATIGGALLWNLRTRRVL